MKTLEHWITTANSKDTTYAAVKPLLEALANELGSDWSLTFNDDEYTAKFTHGVMTFTLIVNTNTGMGLKCGNGKIFYTPINTLWTVTANAYCYADVMCADDGNTVAIGFRSGNMIYGFDLIWGKYDNGSEYLVWGADSVSNSESPATLLDDTATASRAFPSAFESTDAPWCFGKLPKSNHAALTSSLYFGSSVPFRSHYVELLCGDKKYAGFSASKSANSTAAIGKPSMFAVPVETFDVEHIVI